MREGIDSVQGKKIRTDKKQQGKVFRRYGVKAFRIGNGWIEGRSSRFSLEYYTSLQLCSSLPSHCLGAPLMPAYPR